MCLECQCKHMGTIRSMAVETVSDVDVIPSPRWNEDRRGENENENEKERRTGPD